MRYNVICEKVVGIKNIFRKKDSQDSYKYIESEDFIIACVCDGHSTDFFENSKVGAVIGCECFINESIKILNYNNYLDNNIVSYLKDNIYSSWMEKVRTHYYTNNFKVRKVEYIKYSTTMVGIIITNEKLVVIRVGDGNVVIKEDNYYKYIFRNSQNRIVDSLGRFESDSFFIKKIYNIDNKNIKHISIFSDGYENSFSKYTDLYKNLESVYKRYMKNVFTRKRFINSYNNEIKELSTKNRYDDISIIHLIG